MSINFHQLFSVQYLINIDPVRLHPTDQGLLVLGAVLAVFGIGARLISIFSRQPHGRRLWRRLSAWGLTIGLLELLWFGLRYEHAQSLGSHLAAFLILLIGLIWFYYIAKYRFRRYRAEVSQWEKDQVKQKYLQH